MNRNSSEDSTGGRVRIVCVSDTHGYHRDLDLPAGDVVIFAGDMTQGGSMEQLADFDDYLGASSHSRRLVIAGNHDLCFERKPEQSRKVLQHATYLQDEAVEIDGMTIYGAPWQPTLVEGAGSFWAFDLPRGEALAKKWASIPDEVDLLVTHAPPHGIRDEIYTGDAIGCRDLYERVAEVQPDIHVFGHVHERPGVERRDGTVFVNAACPSGHGSAIVLEYDRARGTVRILEEGA